MLFQVCLAAINAFDAYPAGEEIHVRYGETVIVGLFYLVPTRA